MDMGAVGMLSGGVNSGTGALSEEELSEEKLDCDKSAKGVLSCC